MGKLSILFVLALIGYGSVVFGQTAGDYQTKADIYFAQNKFLLALSNYTKAINPDDPDKKHKALMYYKCALCEKNLKQTDKALGDFNTAISLYPEFRGAYWDRGFLYQGNNEYNLAITDYLKAVSMSQGDNKAMAVLYSNLTFCEFKLNDIKTALEYDSIAISNNPHYGRAYLLGGNINSATKQYNLAIADYTSAIFYFDTDTLSLSFLYMARADAKMKLKFYKAAINDLSFAIRIYKDNKSAYWSRATAYHYNGDYKLATNDYTTAISYFQGDNLNLSKLYDDRALNEMRQSMLPEAINDDSTAIALNPQNKAAYLNKALAYTQNADYQKASDYFKKTLDFAADNKQIQAILYYEIATDEYFLNEFDKVVADCTLAISLNSTYPAPYYYRAKVYLKKTNHKDLAVKDFNHVIALDTTKNSVDYIFSLYYTGRGDEALSILQQTLLNANNDANVLTDYYNLACLYSLMNKPEEANIYLKKAIESGYSKKYAIADEDLDNIRQTDDYKSIIAAASN
jgi:tetratricopeptide (TPR) repeat protein